MKLHQKVRYAVACLYELSKNFGEYIDTVTISQNQKIPCAYAHKILQQLARAGLVLAHKGMGYKLARPLQNITALEMMEALSLEENLHSWPDTIGDRLEKRINQALESFTLYELVMSGEVSG